MRVRVNVTRGDIAKGKRRCPWGCPIARRIGLLVTKRAVTIEVVNEVFIATEGDEAVITLPKAARVFIENFDDDEAVKPFAFTLNIPKRFLRPERKGDAPTSA